MTHRSLAHRTGAVGLACGLLAGVFGLYGDVARAAAQNAATSDSAGPPVATVGWVDVDGDGRHDRFRDANGDGINDVNGLSYTHRFGWLDRDNDGLNDLFRDADGDGVNDLARKDDRRPTDVLDNDGDNRNDVTGLAYKPGDLQGERFGFVRECAGDMVWVDEDGDGFPDRPQAAVRAGGEDRFIDRDGDGIADGCWFQDGGFRHQQAQGGQGGPGSPGGSGGGLGSAGSGGWVLR